MKILYVDPIGGLSGDMFLGGLVGLGWPIDSLRSELETLGIAGVRIDVEERRHGAITSLGVRVASQERDVHRHLPEIEALLGADRDGAPAHRRRAREVFRRLARVEARIHGVGVSDVHLHEVGAIDAIADILGVCLALDDLGIKSTYVGPLPLGTGWTTSSHGRIPLPAPATVELLEGAPVLWTGAEGETVTPTGAALAATLAASFGPPPPMRIAGVGWGGGLRPTPPGGSPNVVRLVRGEVASQGDGASWEIVSVLTCHIDDMTPEEMAHLAEDLQGRGALDVLMNPGVMKKGRPGWSLKAIARPADEPALRRRLLAASTTLGVRSRWEGRWILERREGSVATPFGVVRIKWALREDLWDAEPEFESLRGAAEAAGVPLRRVRDAVRRLLPDAPS